MAAGVRRKMRGGVFHNFDPQAGHEVGEGVRAVQR